ncbi:MAG: glutamate racemase [bacterium]
MKIGIFDSGVGGLTVYGTLKKRFPFCDFIYFADTAHLPYGNKSKKAVISYSRRVIGFLAGKGADLIVCACNTASSVAVPELKKESPVPLYGVIEAAAEVAKKSKRVAVIGTKLTIKSRAYERAILGKKSGIKVFVRATPLFVPLVEEGWVGTDVCRSVVEIYLGDIKKYRPDALVLACTHYPVLKGLISDYLGSSVKLIDSSSIVNVLAKRIRQGSGSGRSEFFVSDDPAHFAETAKNVMKIGVKKVKLCTKFV